MQKNKIFPPKDFFNLLYFYSIYGLFNRMDMAQHNELGHKGEHGGQYLESEGHRILEKNWRLHGYEIDIITTHGDCIVFVEVKTYIGDGVIRRLCRYNACR